MSYRLVTRLPTRRRPRGEIGPHLLGAPQSSYSIMPLSDAPLATGMSESTKRMIVIVVVIVGLLLLAWWFSQGQRPRSNTGAKLETRKEALGRASTGDLAKRLYERLDKKGGANPATLRSLQRYARKS